MVDFLMDNNCSLSIIIPAYNVENYILETLESLKYQTVPPEEIILINDGSTDKTLELANSFNLFCSYNILNTKNKGQGNARNIGVRLSSSEYIYFLDSDDLIRNDFVEEVKKKLIINNYPDILLFSGTSFYDPLYHGNFHINYTRGFEGKFYSATDLLKESEHHGYFSCSPCLYVSKRNLWGEEGLRFGNMFFEDDAIFYPLLYSCQRIVVSDICLFYRRVRSSSTMTMKRNAKHANGYLDGLKNTLSLANKSSSSGEEKKYLSKRIKSFSYRYIHCCNQASEKIQYRYLFAGLIFTKSLAHLIKMLAYYCGFPRF